MLSMTHLKTKQEGPLLCLSGFTLSHTFTANLPGSFCAPLSHPHHLRPTDLFSLSTDSGNKMYAGSSIYTSKCRKITLPLYLSFLAYKVCIMIFKVKISDIYIYLCIYTE